jgi:hypothetical protein
MNILSQVERKCMKTSILFPYRIKDDNRNAFAFAVEMARRSNTDIIALTSLELSRQLMLNKDRLENAITNKKNEIYCNLLEMKGYYHGRFNQWNTFDEVNIHVQLINYDMNGAICAAIKDHTDLVIILQQKYFSGTGLYEELASGSLTGNVSFFMLPGDKKFDEPSPDLIGVLFNQQKRSAFIKLLHETKIIDLPEQYDRFREEMIIQRAV